MLLDININIIYTCRGLKTICIKVPLLSLCILSMDEIEKILVSLIEKRLVKQKVKGESLVQVSSGLTNGLWSQSNKFTGATEENIRKRDEKERKDRIKK